VLTGKYNDSLENAGRLNLPGYEWLKAVYESDEGRPRLEKARKLAVLAGEMGTPMHHLALAWCLKNPHVSTVILGASKLAQLEDNLKALNVVPQLNDPVMAAIEAIVQNRPPVPSI
jgi:aryl-alcohol dehydrogenase-like predicted oxidoreductase